VYEFSSCLSEKPNINICKPGVVHLPDCHQRFTTTAIFAKLAKIFAQSRRNFAVQTDCTLSGKYVYKF
jgi:hypothetical protein